MLIVSFFSPLKIVCVAHKEAKFYCGASTLTYHIVYLYVPFNIQYQDLRKNSFYFDFLMVLESNIL